ncbi:hypothetical protein THF1C08_240007 [Vibrio jasicida]|nr:hypothetical protein THF1C08_240007 [Vibrio jasicida]
MGRIANRNTVKVTIKPDQSLQEAFGQKRASTNALKRFSQIGKSILMP